MACCGTYDAISGDCMVKLGGSGMRELIMLTLLLTGNCACCGKAALVTDGTTVTEGLMGARATCAIANRLAGELETVPTACSIKKIQNVDDINSC